MKNKEIKYYAHSANKKSEIQMTKKKNAKNKKPSFNDLVNAIGNLAMETQKIAEKHGLFLHHRELLECRCGLEEDVTMEERLIVCRKEAEGNRYRFTFS